MSEDKTKTNPVKAGMMRAMIKVFLPCRRVQALASRSLDKKPPPATRLRLILHYLVCRYCRRYDRQIRHLKRFARKLPEHRPVTDATKLTPAARERLREALKSERR